MPYCLWFYMFCFVGKNQVLEDFKTRRESGSLLHAGALRPALARSAACQCLNMT